MAASLLLGLALLHGCAGDDAPPMAAGGAGTAAMGSAGSGPATMAAAPAASGGNGATAMPGGPMARAGLAGSPATPPNTTPMAGSSAMPASNAGMSMGMMGTAAAGSGMPGAPTGPGAMGMGACCADGNCLCHGPDPTALTVEPGPYKTESYSIGAGTVHYPTDAEPPFAAVALCGGFLNTGPEMASWGPLYASYGIVTIITSTGASDSPQMRSEKLLAAVADMKAENGKADSPLAGKLSDRFGTSGYSMGGGGTTIAAAGDATLKTSVGLAAFGGSGDGTMVPTLLLCGSADTTAPCPMSQSVYGAIPDATPKMIVTVSGATHFSWFGPTDTTGGVSGQYALAFQKVYLEGDERWKPILLQMAQGAMQETNIK